MAGHPNTRSSGEDMPAFLKSMHQAVTTLSLRGGGEEQAANTASYEPAVSARKSLASPDHTLSMIDGKPDRTLKRRLSRHGLTPAEYRERYKLKADYPMVARGHSEARSAVARTLGLGRKAGTKIKSTKASPPPKPPVRRRINQGSSKDMPNVE